MPPDINIIDQTLAHRRGMVLGLTLAEVMLIVLFCILMLFSIFIKNQEQIPTGPIAGDPISENGRLRKLLNAQERENQILLSNVNRQKEENEQLEKENEGLEKENEGLEKENEGLEGTLAKKPGDKPPCMFTPRYPDQKRPSQGPISQREAWSSVSLGIVYIEPNQLTLVNKNKNIPQLKPVDWLGDPFEYKEAYNLIMEWEEDTPLLEQEYKEKGEPFIRIGDNASPEYQCRFTMDFIMEDGTPLDMKRLVFEQPFFPQNRVAYEKLHEYYRP